MEEVEEELGTETPTFETLAPPSEPDPNLDNSDSTFLPRIIGETGGDQKPDGTSIQNQVTGKSISLPSSPF